LAAPARLPKCDSTRTDNLLIAPSVVALPRAKRRLPPSLPSILTMQASAFDLANSRSASALASSGESIMVKCLCARC
jgi:hypothetical protein